MIGRLPKIQILKMQIPKEYKSPNGNPKDLACMMEVNSAEYIVLPLSGSLPQSDVGEPSHNLMLLKIMMMMMMMMMMRTFGSGMRPHENPHHQSCEHTRIMSPPHSTTNVTTKTANTNNESQYHKFSPPKLVLTKMANLNLMKQSILS